MNPVWGIPGCRSHPWTITTGLGVLVLAVRFILVLTGLLMGPTDLIRASRAFNGVMVRSGSMVGSRLGLAVESNGLNGWS